MKPNQRNLKKYYFIEPIFVVLTIYKHTVDVTLHDNQDRTDHCAYGSHV